MRVETERTRLGRHQMLGEILWHLGFVGYFIGVGAFFLIFRPDDPSTGELAAAVFYVVLGASGLCWLRTEITNYRQPAHIELHAGRIDVFDPSSLEEPLELSQRAIRLISIDDRPVTEKRGDVRRRFALAGSVASAGAQQSSNWLYSSKPEDDVGLHAIGPTDEAPNVAILLNEPVFLMPSNRVKNFFCNPRVAAKRWIRGIRMRVENPDIVRDAAQRMNLLRDVTAADLAAIQPSPEEAQHARFFNRVQWAWLTITVVVWVGSFVLYMLGGD